MATKHTEGTLSIRDARVSFPCGTTTERSKNGVVYIDGLSSVEYDEMVRRWNAHADLLAACEGLMRRLVLRQDIENDEYAAAEAALAKSRGEAS